jgi:predicted CXXCH cytochrome family protein
MTLEQVLVCALLLAALVPLARWLRSPGWRIGLLLFFGASVATTFAWYDRIQKREQTKQSFREKAPREGRPGGYVSSETCRSCHPDQYASWHDSFHRTMTQYPSAEAVRGDFNHVTLELQGETYRLERRGDQFWVDMVEPDWTYVRILQDYAFRTGQAKQPPPDITNPPRTNLPISLVTGSHHMQAYWVSSVFGNMQFGFPFTYLFEDKRWVPRADVFLFPPGGKFTMQVWNANCINCHATAGQQRQDPKTKIIDSRAAEMGIACEACHGPAEQHVSVNLDPKRRYAARLEGKGDPTIFNPARADHVKASEACGQCHAIRQKRNQEQWNEHGLLYRPGGELESLYPLLHYNANDLDVNEKERALMQGSFWSDGMVRVSGRDFSGMSASACYSKGELSCLSCHSLHQYASRTNQLIAGMESNQACLQCHKSYGEKLEQHTHHKAGSSGSLCYNCHMPHTSYGLLKAIRSHQINSPTVKASLDTGRPNACNLCHLDKTLAWTGDKLKEWYGQPLEPLSAEQKSVSAALLWMLTGDAGQRSLIAWHMGWQPAKEISGWQWMAPQLAQMLLDPYSIVRFISKRSLKRLPGYENFAYDYIAPEQERLSAKAQALSIWQRQARATVSAPSEVLLEPDGSLKRKEVDRLWRRRNDQRMELLE